MRYRITPDTVVPMIPGHVVQPGAVVLHLVIQGADAEVQRQRHRDTIAGVAEGEEEPDRHRPRPASLLPSISRQKMSASPAGPRMTGQSTCSV